MSTRQSAYKSLRATTALAIIFGSFGGANSGAGEVKTLRVPQSSASDTGLRDWSSAGVATISYDFTYRRPAAELTTVSVLQDASGLGLRFDVHQAEPITATQRTNGSGVLTDDYVGAYFAPLGNHGFTYGFFANPAGTRYQTSSENSAYAPQWAASGERTKDGYVVTMFIPFDIIHFAGSKNWSAQFVRNTLIAGSLTVWNFSSSASAVNDPTFFGLLVGVGPAGVRRSALPRPRAQLYGLAEIASPSVGGSTSRIGADIAIPYSQTGAFVGAFHPDYSNVEIDQQTIAPSAFAHQYTEVRPFFTQGATFYNQDICTNCPLTLYTPSIPTFSQGYAVEGTQGHVQYAAFDAIGHERTDQAQTLNYAYEDPNEALDAYAQRVAVAGPSLGDVTSTLDLAYTNEHSHLFAYANNGIDRGTQVADPGQADYFEDGVGYGDSTSNYTIAYQRIGEYFNPFDGYVAQTNIMGYFMYAQKQFTYPSSHVLHDVTAAAFDARFWNNASQLAQTDATEQLSIDFSDLLTLRMTASWLGVRTFGAFLPFEQNSVLIGYRVNTALPTSIQYTGGAYYRGSLLGWAYVATLPIARKVNLSAQAYENKYVAPIGSASSTSQWLERTSLDWQMSRDAQLDLGVRRIIGRNVPTSYAPFYGSNASACAGDPSLPGCFVNATNVSMAFHLLTAKNEFYVVYGDPNSLATTPGLFLKWIRYIGAEKGA